MHVGSELTRNAGRSFLIWNAKVKDTQVFSENQRHSFFPESKIDELHRSLTKKNAEIYIERARKMPASREHLMIWVVTNLQVVISNMCKK